MLEEVAQQVFARSGARDVEVTGGGKDKIPGGRREAARDIGGAWLEPGMRSWVAERLRKSAAGRQDCAKT